MKNWKDPRELLLAIESLLKKHQLSQVFENSCELTIKDLEALTQVSMFSRRWVWVDCTENDSVIAAIVGDTNLITGETAIRKILVNYFIESVEKRLVQTFGKVYDMLKEVICEKRDMREHALLIKRRRSEQAFYYGYPAEMACP